MENRQIYLWKQENHQSDDINKIIKAPTLHTNIAETHTNIHANMGLTHRRKVCNIYKSAQYLGENVGKYKYINGYLHQYSRQVYFGLLRYLYMYVNGTCEEQGILLFPKVNNISNYSRV